jgi:hypothetical protein
MVMTLQVTVVQTSFLQLQKNNIISYKQIAAG